MTDVFDFGFTAVDEEELESYKQVSSVASSTQDKVDKLYNAIIPILNNLKANPEKDYILWPNRLQKVEEFEDYLTCIYKE